MRSMRRSWCPCEDYIPCYLGYSLELRTEIGEEDAVRWQKPALRAWGTMESVISAGKQFL